MLGCPTESRARDQVPGSCHSLELLPLQQSWGTLGTVTREGGCHHPRQPGLVHAVHHPIGLVDDLWETSPGVRMVAEIGSHSQLGPLPGGWPTYQEAELLEAEPWRLVDVVHQAAWGGHHDVSQAAEAVGSAEQEKVGGSPTRTPRRHSLGREHTYGPCPLPLSPQPRKTYVFWTRLSCSLASDFCPVTRATRRGVASV